MLLQHKCHACHDADQNNNHVEPYKAGCQGTSVDTKCHCTATSDHGQGTMQHSMACKESYPACSRASASSLSTLDLSRWRAFRSRWKSQLVPTIPTPFITMFSSTAFSSGASLPPVVHIHRRESSCVAYGQTYIGMRKVYMCRKRGEGRHAHK